MAEFVASSKSGSVLVPAPDDPEALRRDADARREDLVASVAALKRTVSEKLDVQKQAKRFVLVGKERAEVAIEQVRARAKQRPALFIGVAVGVVAVVATGYAIYKRSQPPRWRRQLETYRRALSENVYIRIGRPDAVE